MFGKGEGWVILYASAHEKEVPNGPLRRGVGLPESSFPAIEVAGSRPRAHSLHDIFDAIFARLEERLPVALAPPPN